MIPVKSKARTPIKEQQNDNRGDRTSICPALTAPWQILVYWHLPRWPFSRREADAIMALTLPAGLEAVGFGANRSTAPATIWRQYRIVHFATHGYRTTGRPELSGLVLSLG